MPEKSSVVQVNFTHVPLPFHRKNVGNDNVRVRTVGVAEILLNSHPIRGTLLYNRQLYPKRTKTIIIRVDLVPFEITCNYQLSGNRKLL